MRRWVNAVTAILAVTFAAVGLQGCSGCADEDAPGGGGSGIGISDQGRLQVEPETLTMPGSEVGVQVTAHVVVSNIGGEALTLTGARIEEEFYVGIRKDDGSDVAPFQNDPASFCNRAPSLDEVCPKLRVNGHHGRSVRDPLLPNGLAYILPVEKDALETLPRELDSRARRQSRKRFAVVHVDVLAQRFEGDGPKRGTRIQIDQG